MVMVATVTHPYQTPSAAAEVAYRIGAAEPLRSTSPLRARASATASALASDMIRGGSARYVLVVGVEKLSDWVNLDRPRHRVHLRRRRRCRRGRPVRGARHRPGRLGLGRRPEGRHHDDAVPRSTTSENGGPTFPTLEMQGQQVFRWAVGEMAKVGPAGARRGRGRRRRPRRLHPAPGEHAHHRRHGARRSSCPSTWRWPATSPTPATPPPPRSRWPWSAMLDDGEAPTAGPRTAHRLRRRPGLRRPGRHPPLAPPLPRTTARRTTARTARAPLVRRTRKEST